MNKLNFGCGSIQPEGWVNVDKDVEFNAYAKIGNTFWSTLEGFPDDHFDIIVAHAVVQQFEWHRMVVELKELRRVLKPGGVLRISLPDISAGFKAWIRGEKEWFPNGEEDINDRFSAWLTWYSTSKTLLTEESLENKLHEAGFSEVIYSDFRMSAGSYPNATTELDTREREFFFMEAKK